MHTAFTKYHGAGNDFVVIDANTDSLPPDVVQSLCDRNTGIGADGVLLAIPDPETDGRMAVFNADGSRAEMCGNGLRCIAFHLASRCHHSSLSVPINVATDSGIKSCLVYFDPAEPEALVHTDLGFFSEPKSITIDLAGHTVCLYTTSLGNPHAVIIDPPAGQSFSDEARAIATHPSFTHGANVSFATQEGDGFRVLVWERGVGPTRACGTAACAVAAVAVYNGLGKWETPIPICLPGGTLHATITQDCRAVLFGPARRVFCGTF